MTGCGSLCSTPVAEDCMMLRQGPQYKLPAWAIKGPLALRLGALLPI